jgi:hypothetical protein
MVEMEVQARDDRVERQRVLDEYRIPFKSFGEQWPTRPKTREPIVYDEKPIYFPFSRLPLTRDIQSAMFRERWKATKRYTHWSTK